MDRQIVIFPTRKIRTCGPDGLTFVPELICSFRQARSKITDLYYRVMEKRNVIANELRGYFEVKILHINSRSRTGSS